ncbi:MAG: carbohydrate kinase [Paracoccaceae bacterium]
MILCAGEALIDMLPVEGPGGQTAFRPVPGGAVFNTAIALGRLGVPTGFWGGISRDQMGARLMSALSAAGVDCQAVTRSERPTTLAFAEMKDGVATYRFEDENSATRMLTPADIPPIEPPVRALFCGGIGLATDPCGAAFEALATNARQVADLPVMIDLNIRPALVEDAARYRARLARMMALADIVKLSTEDLDWLFGRADRQDQARWARGLLAAGGATRLVVITDGAAGARGYSAAGEHDEPAPPVRVVDTIGAGDTFNAGLLAGLWSAGMLTRAALARLDLAALAAAMGLGAAAAAITVGRAGADPPWKEEVWR